MALNDCILEVCADETADWYESEEGWLICGVYFAPADIESHFVPDSDARRIFRRTDLRAVVGHFSFGLHELIERPCNYVTLLRNPIERIVSLYRHILRWDHESVHNQVVSRLMSLEEFARTLPFDEIDNGQTYRIAGVAHPFHGTDKELLASALRNLEQFAVVGLTERYKESVLMMKHRLGWRSMPTLVRKNADDTPLRDRDVPASTIAAILQRNQLDMALYEFASRLLQRQIEDAGQQYHVELKQLHILERGAVHSRTS
jgi:hypothetical protein